MKVRICANCGTEFTSGSPQALYCKIACQRTAKTKRRLSREQHIAAQPSVTDERFFATVDNPTVILLSKYAELVKDGLTNNKPIVFTGTIPFWTPPDGVALVEQQGVEPKQFLMLTYEMVESPSPI